MRILITATVQSHICQFHLPLIKMLQNEGHTVDVAARNNLDVKPGLSLKCADNVFDVPFERSPLKPENIKAYKLLKKIINENDYDIIHCNTPMGGVITRLAAAKKRRNGTKVIYTAHGFHFYNGAPIKNWLIYYPIEWLLSYKTDTLICINTEDYELARARFHAKATEYVAGVGFDSERCKRSRTKEQAKAELNIPENSSVLFSIGELNRRKNHEVVIDALADIKRKDIYWFIAGNGPLEGYLKQRVKELGMSDNIFFIGYTREITKYFEAADIFVFPSLQEGLPVALMETMCFGIPIIASDIRGTRDLIKDGEGGYLLETNDKKGFAEKISSLLKNDELKNRMSAANRANVKKFESENVLKSLKAIYGRYT